jgi:hypothetical protein
MVREISFELTHNAKRRAFAWRLLLLLNLLPPQEKGDDRNSLLTASLISIS